METVTAGMAVAVFLVEKCSLFYYNGDSRYGETESRSEVLRMLLTEYDEKKQMKVTYEEGVEAGMDMGREQMGLLTKQLLQDERLEELKRAAEDKDYAAELMEEYGIAKHK